LENKLNHNNLANDLEHHKEVIKQVMENDIVAAYYYQAGAIENSLRHDKQLDAAIELLNDTERYRSILSAPTE
jgi:carboxyl-terminal processing protease